MSSLKNKIDTRVTQPMLSSPKTFKDNMNAALDDFRFDHMSISQDLNDYSDWGATATAGLHITEKLQPFAEYQFGSLNGTMTDLSVVTIGVNYWFNDNVKITVDGGYALNAVDGGWNDGTAGWGTGDNTNQYVIRGQFQVQF